MKKASSLLYLLPFLLAACGTSKTYFTTGIRARLENNHQLLEQVQFYADRDIILRRELETRDAKITSGKVKLENGHYVNIITLPKNTPGVCTVVKNNVVGVSFEAGDNHFLTFGKTKYAKTDDPYRILANEWVNDYGVIFYDGKKYHIQPEGTEASLLIKTKLLRKDKIEEREMKGRKVADASTTTYVR